MKSGVFLLVGYTFLGALYCRTLATLSEIYRKTSLEPFFNS